MRLLLLTALCLCACAPKNDEAVKRDSLQGAGVSSAQLNAMAAQMAEMQARMRAAQQIAETQCAPLRNHEVSYEEERAIGAELAVASTAQLGHLYLDGATEKDPQKLVTMLESRQPVTLPPGGKNAVSAHVAVVGRTLAHFSSRPNLPWVFGVIQSDTAQSFSTPGGFVFVTTGLLKKMTNEAQLAGVLAHEIAHVTKKSMLHKYVETKYAQCTMAKQAATMIKEGLATSMPGSSMEAAKFAEDFDKDFDPSTAKPQFKMFLFDSMMMMLQLGNDKEAEFEADKTALELVSFAGYDAVQYEQFLTTWAQDKHPASNERAVRLQALRQGELKDFVHGTAKPELGKVFAPLSAP